MKWIRFVSTKPQNTNLSGGSRNDSHCLVYSFHRLLWQKMRSLLIPSSNLLLYFSSVSLCRRERRRPASKWIRTDFCGSIHSRTHKSSIETFSLCAPLNSNHFHFDPHRSRHSLFTRWDRATVVANADVADISFSISFSQQKQYTYCANCLQIHEIHFKKDK